MQLHIRDQSQHVLECEGNEIIAQVKARIAAMENVTSDAIVLFAAGAPVSDDSLVSEFAATDLELYIPLLGGKVHGYLARAGKVKSQTPKVEKQKKKKKKTGRAKKRMQYNRRFVKVVRFFGRRRGPNCNS